MKSASGGIRKLERKRATTWGCPYIGRNVKKKGKVLKFVAVGLIWGIIVREKCQIYPIK
jgi:hypothetical protein